MPKMPLRKTLWDDRAREELLLRLDRLSPESTALWGRMNAGEMIAHVLLGMRMAGGELEARPRRSPFRYWPLKYIFVYWFPFPHGAPAPREVVTRGKDFAWDENLAALRTVLADFPMVAPAKWPLHPVFGKLSPRAWGALGWRHLDHHLRQFGV
jgi:hypothetical protein